MSSTQEKLNFRLGRRAGFYEKLDDLYDANKYRKVDEAIKRVTSEAQDSVDEVILQLKEHFI